MKGKGKKRRNIEKSAFLLGLASLLWLLFRTGTKPSRIVYPCQRAAAVSSYTLLKISILSSLNIALRKVMHFSTSKKGKAVELAIVLLIGVLITFFEIQETAAVDPFKQVSLTLNPHSATATPASDIFVVNRKENNITGQTAGAALGQLINLMGSHGLLFYKSSTSGVNKGPDGLIARNDVVLIKINEEWPYRGGTNTDLLKALIEALVNHPDGFVGEIVVADNGQWQGSMDWGQSNAEDITQSTQDVVNMFSSLHNVSTFTWMNIKTTHVNEYSAGDMGNGYILYNTADPETGLNVSYPKFRTQFGTYISFKYGIWNGTGYEERLKVINMPVLKSHSNYGVTGALKHYMGVLSEGRWGGGLSNGHASVATGGMGTEMVEARFPVLNILDAIWVNANPRASGYSGPSTPYNCATRVNVIMASTDPVALDYWAAKHVLMQAASLIGYSNSDIASMDPDNPNRFPGLEEAFGVWLNKSRDEINLHTNRNVTTDESHMNVYVMPAYNLNLRIRDWDLTDNIQGAQVYKDSEMKVSDVNGWANWTGVGGTVNIKVKWFGFWVNGTFTVTMNGNKTIDVRCRIFDITITCQEGLQQAWLQNVNVTVYNATSGGKMIRTGTTGPNGVVNLNNVPNGTLTFKAYDGNNNPNAPIAQVTLTISYEGQQVTIVCDQYSVTTELKWELLVRL